MRLKLALPALLSASLLLGGCGTDTANSNSGGNTGNAGATSNASVPKREGVIETNVNMPPNMNGNNSPSNTATVTNNNGNKNTAGVSTTNSGGHNGNNH